MKWFVIESHLKTNPYIKDTGWGNGYVVIPKNSRLNKSDFYEQKVDVHGGITFQGDFSDLPKNILTGQCDEQDTVIGFDTGHAYDNSSNCPKVYVVRETLYLRTQLMKLEYPFLFSDHKEIIWEMFEESYRESKSFLKNWK